MVGFFYLLKITLLRAVLTLSQSPAGVVAGKELRAGSASTAVGQQ